jgi:hypothetical protein
MTKNILKSNEFSSPIVFAGCQINQRHDQGKSSSCKFVMKD